MVDVIDGILGDRGDTETGGRGRGRGTTATMTRAKVAARLAGRTEADGGWRIAKRRMARVRTSGGSCGAATVHHYGIIRPHL